MWDDDVWRPGTESTTASLRELGPAAHAAGAVYAMAYTLELGLSLLTYFGNPETR